MDFGIIRQLTGTDYPVDGVSRVNEIGLSEGESPSASRLMRPGDLALGGLFRSPDRRQQDVEQPHLGGEVEQGD